MLSEHQPAPDFTLLDDTGAERSLSAEAGKWVVIYFYPKDDTPGCTKEACAIRDIYDDFAKLGVTVFGVSRDSVASHVKFKEKYQLPFSLLSDEAGTMIDAYGALQEKSMFGKTHQGIQRMSYLINPEGKVSKVYPKVSPTEHAHEILADIKTLQST
jgi:peroxiredoxin Q/BCP